MNPLISNSSLLKSLDSPSGIPSSDKIKKFFFNCLSTDDFNDDPENKQYCGISGCKANINNYSNNINDGILKRNHIFEYLGVKLVPFKMGFFNFFKTYECAKELG